MRRWAPFLLMLVAAPVAADAAPPTALGIFDGWGAFRDPTTPRCYALASPSATIGKPQIKGYASVGYWPRSRIRGQFYVRLSKARAPGRELRLTIGSRRFILTGNGEHGRRNRRRDAVGAEHERRKWYADRPRYRRHLSAARRRHGDRRGCAGVRQTAIRRFREMAENCATLLAIHVFPSSSRTRERERMRRQRASSINLDHKRIF
jgi:hypothetical protein